MVEQIMCKINNCKENFVAKYASVPMNMIFLEIKYSASMREGSVFYIKVMWQPQTTKATVVEQDLYKVVH